MSVSGVGPMVHLRSVSGVGPMVHLRAVDGGISTMDKTSPIFDKLLNVTNSSILDCLEENTFIPDVASIPDTHHKTSNLAFVVIICTISVLITVIGAPISFLILFSIVTCKGVNTCSNAFLASLAVRDFIVTSFAVPIFMLDFLQGKYPFNPLICRVQLSVIFSLGLGTVMEFMNIAINRYVKLCCHPITHVTIYSKKVTSLLLTVTWTLSFLLGLPPALLYGTLEKSNQMCYIKQSPMKAAIATMIILSAIVVTTFCYIQILRRICEAKMKLKQYHEGPAQHRKVNNTIRKFCCDFSVFAIYIFLLLPFVMINGFGLTTPRDLAWDLAKLSSYLNNVSNSIIYGLFNPNLRHCFYRLLHLDTICAKMSKQNTVHPFYLSYRHPLPRDGNNSSYV